MEKWFLSQNNHRLYARFWNERRQNFAPEEAAKKRKTTPPALHKSMSGKTATFDDKASPVVHADDPEFGDTGRPRFVKVVSYTMASSNSTRWRIN